jgi:hypothetical protein
MEAHRTEILQDYEVVKGKVDAGAAESEPTKLTFRARLAGRPPQAYVAIAFDAGAAVEPVALVAVTIQVIA